MFEAINGSAPAIAGQNIANPSGLIQGAIMMLNHIGETQVAETILNAWLKTIEDGIHTADIYNEGVSKKNVSTEEFSRAVINNLGKKPSLLNSITYPKGAKLQLPKYKRKPKANKELIGMDVFVHWNGNSPDELAKIVQPLETERIYFKMMTNRGIKVWPDGFNETFCTDHWRCRFKTKDEKAIEKEHLLELLIKANKLNIDVIKTENLYSFDGRQAFSLGQGQ
jgi:isocitrate dehydrogenase